MNLSSNICFLHKHKHKNVKHKTKPLFSTIENDKKHKWKCCATH